jgi:hypothetical protein
MEFVTVKITSVHISGIINAENVSFSMAGLCHGQNGQFQPERHDPWSKLLV